jgi:hypothetical protein
MSQASFFVGEPTDVRFDVTMAAGTKLDPAKCRDGVIERGLDAEHIHDESGAVCKLHDHTLKNPPQPAPGKTTIGYGVATAGITSASTSIQLGGIEIVF